MVVLNMYIERNLTWPLGIQKRSAPNLASSKAPAVSATRKDTLLQNVQKRHQISARIVNLKVGSGASTTSSQRVFRNTDQGHRAGHKTMDCTENRKLDQHHVPDKLPEEAWALLKTASDEKDLGDFREVGISLARRSKSFYKTNI